MRTAILTLFLIGGCTAFCQIPAQAPDNPAATAEVTTVLAPVGHFILNLSPQVKIAPAIGQSRTDRNPFPAPGMLPTQKNGKAEPLPTQWPNAKFELIPTQWPHARVELVGGHNAEPKK